MSGHPPGSKWITTENARRRRKIVQVSLGARGRAALAQLAAAPEFLDGAGRPVASRAVEQAVLEACEARQIVVQAVAEERKQGA